MVRADISVALIEQIRRLRVAFFDFDGVFTDNFVYLLEDGREAVRCSRGDGLGLRRLERVGVEPFVVSTETNPIVGMRCRKMKIGYSQAIDDKVREIRRLTELRGVDMADVAFIGNDVNDLGCLKLVGLPVVVKDAHPDVLGAALYHTECVGGSGAVREFCDLVADLRGDRQE